MTNCLCLFEFCFPDDVNIESEAIHNDQNQTRQVDKLRDK